MPNGLPPLNALRAFEAAARHSNFTRAAEELGMTQAAVSYQIKVLEDRTGKPLFNRVGRQVVLTNAGAQLAAVASEAFQSIRAGFSAVQGTQDGTLKLSVVPTFAMNWLSLRIGGFQMANPKIAVQLEVSGDVVDFASSDIDIGIRNSPKKWPGLCSFKLAEVTYTPMLSPGLADSIGGVNKPEDLLKLPIIDTGDPWWRNWFEAAGVKDPDFSNQPVSQMGTQTVDGNIAIAGHGVAILTPLFHSSALRDGLLIQPFPLKCTAENPVWLVYRETQKNNRKIKLFRDWILSEMEKDKAGYAV
ncbi:LysR family transcriptional regulator, glycine cleavage system transcriptional activator [Pseudovibrio ascidiaceicola]|uniref:LysR family transcriptional regulator, glycine cleavage system transcriptional activator n=1 Tax=Pseudovibrio ascidiaceicola TaxID=285279 RepID=A0A1I3YN15_9HYPH|nr:LysR substrate-binding domain-containing protein [Pseudovibrio ascidiaceicola]SFK33258.1 LysR family transcriptional regulator, glycine cleavage system transcriptional activator [Pseudovibrio ascidiaceicola]